jgi:hypothetical protein
MESVVLMLQTTFYNIIIVIFFILRHITINMKIYNELFI